MTMGLFMRPSLALTHSMRLTHAQQLQLHIQELELRLHLVEAVQERIFKPMATCPECTRALTHMEIMEGFCDDPRDFTTMCPKCETRFAPRLRTGTISGSIEVAFYCPMQVLDQLKDMVDTPLDDFRSAHAELYHSAVVHFGGLKQAFKKCGLVYTHEADLDWKKQVASFLGKLPDTMIAELVGTHVSNVQRLRVRSGIRAYDRHIAAASLA